MTDAGVAGPDQRDLAVADLARRIGANDRHFRALAEQASRVARPASAAALVQAAAEFAWFNHTGWYASLQLEATVRRLAQDLPVVARRRPGRPATLHVLTQAYQTGGSTQAVACWTEAV